MVTPLHPHLTSPGRDIPGSQVLNGPREAAAEEGRAAGRGQTFDDHAPARPCPPRRLRRPASRRTVMEQKWLVAASARRRPDEGRPKTDASMRIIALDAETIAILRAHRRRQRAKNGSRWGRRGREPASGRSTYVL
ncbi:hypothetical protein GCM10010404_54880 [Nonomuraea africana]